MLKIVYNKFKKNGPLEKKKNKKFNYRMLDLGWDVMLAQDW